MAHVVNPYNLDDDDDAVFSALLSEGLIWIEDDDEDDEGEGENRRNSEIELLETSIGIKVHTFKEHRKRINAIVVSGDFVFSGSDDRTLCVWNWRTGEHLRTLSGHRSNVSAIVVGGDFIISASDDKTLRVWNWKTGEHLRTLTEHMQKVSALAIDGDVIAAACLGELWVWNWQTGELLQKLTESHLNGQITTAIDGDFLLSASPDLVVVQNWKTGENLHTFSLHNNAVHEQLSLGLDKNLAILNDSYNVQLWNWKTDKHLAKSELRDKKNFHINTKAFLVSSDVCVYSLKIDKWCLYPIDAAYDKVALVEDYSHIITTDHAGWIYVIRTYPSLKRIITGNLNPDPVAAPRNKAKAKAQKKSTTPQIAQSKAEVLTEVIKEYTTEDVLQAASRFIHRRNEKWVNFSRVSQHLLERFYHLKQKRLGQSAKRYRSLIKFFENYSSEFELREDSEKPGLYWIRLKPKS